MNITFGRNESFIFRDGWGAKGIDAVSKYGNKAFDKTDGMRNLGIGSNMVHSLRYWMRAGNILSPKNYEFTEFGKAICSYDRYMLKKLTWYLYHYYLATNQALAPVFYYMFVVKRDNYISTDELSKEITEYYSKLNVIPSERSLKNDISKFFETYATNSEKENPENNITCQLRKLNLISREEKDEYHFNSFRSEDIFYLVVMYILNSLYDKSFDIADAYDNPLGPANIFKITYQDFTDYLAHMEREGWITINRTASLNSVYLNRI